MSNLKHTAPKSQCEYDRLAWSAYNLLRWQMSTGTYLVNTGSCAPITCIRTASRKIVDATRKPQRIMACLSQRGRNGFPRRNDSKIAQRSKTVNCTQSHRHQYDTVQQNLEQYLSVMMKPMRSLKLIPKGSLHVSSHRLAILPSSQKNCSIHYPYLC